VRDNRLICGRGSSPPATFRAVFSPKNANIASWISDTIDG